MSDLFAIETSSTAGLNEILSVTVALRFCSRLVVTRTYSADKTPGVWERSLHGLDTTVLENDFKDWAAYAFQGVFREYQ